MTTGEFALETLIDFEELAEIQAPPPAAYVTLRSGRCYELESGDEADRLVVRARSGDVILRIQVTDSGPVLSFHSASVSLAATRALELSAESVTVRATCDVVVEADGDVVQRAGRHHHVEARGDVRVEAANLELLAAEGSAELLARGAVAIDGEHVGLNDKPLPVPFPWSKVALEDAPAESRSARNQSLSRRVRALHGAETGGGSAAPRTALSRTR